jgi:hypothetical protein
MTRKAGSIMRYLRLRHALALAGFAVMVALAATGSAFADSGTQNGTTHSDVFFYPIAGTKAPPSCTALVSFPAAFYSEDVNSVQHGTVNNNGGWGGETSTGQATLYALNGDGSLGAAQYVGHVTEWDGGGGNQAGQTSGGFTLDFHGTSVTNPSQTLQVHANGHMTTNNAGIQTAAFTNVSCSS